MAIEFPTGDASRRRRHGTDAPPATPTAARATPDTTRTGEAVPRSVVLSAAEAQGTALDDVLTKEFGFNKEYIKGSTWERTKYYLGKAIASSAVVFATGSGVKYGLVAAGLATAPAWATAIGVGSAGIAASLMLRSALGWKHTDKMAQAGRTGHKARKSIGKLEKDAKKIGMDVSTTRENLEAQVRTLNKERTFAPMAVSLVSSAIIGNIGSEIHSGGWGKGPVTSGINQGVERASEGGSWLYQKISSLWHTICGTESEAMKAAAKTHLAMCDVQIEKAVAPLQDALTQRAATIDGYSERLFEIQQQLRDAIARGAIAEDRAGTLTDELSEAQLRIAELSRLNRGDTVLGYEEKIGECERTVRELEEALRRGSVEPPAASPPIEPLEHPRRMPRAFPVPPMEDLPEAPPAPLVPAEPPPQEAPAPRPRAMLDGETIPDGVATVVQDPLDIQIQPGDALATNGLDGLMNEHVLKALGMTDAPMAVKLQFIEAFRAVLVEHPDFAQELLNTDKDVIVQGANGLDVRFVDCEWVNTRVIGDDEFLELLTKELEAQGSKGPKYSKLVAYLKVEGDDVGTIINTLRSRYSA